MRRSKETWIEATKVLACVLIAAGNIFQNAVKASLIDSTVTYLWFNRTINFFVFPLLFICAGYMYQQGKPVATGDAWRSNVLKVLVILGVPYLLFSGANWGLKVLLSGDVSNWTESLLQELFIRPLAPYWCLLALLLVFLVTPTISKTLSAVVIGGLALGAKGITLLFGSSGIYVLDALLSHWLWFVAGMLLSYVKAPKALRKQKGAQTIALALTVLFFAGSVAVVMRDVSSGIVGFIFGICGCSAVVILAITMKFSEGSRKTVRRLGEYTLPVLLMHTIFATGVRAALLNFGVANAIIHIAAGLVISLAGPVFVAFIFKKLKWAEFVLYPGKFIKFKSENGEKRHGKKA